MSNKSFFQYNPNELRFITFDIETTGFKAGENDIVTTIVAHDTDTYHVWLNTNGNEDINDTQLLEYTSERCPLNNIMLYVLSSEQELFENFSEFITNLPKDGTIFTAFNGETYRGSTDFDLPFLRTRFFSYGLSWPFTGFWYTDSYEVFSQKNRFDTTITEIPTLDNLKKSEQQKFVDDMNLNVHYQPMKKAEIIDALNNNAFATEENIKLWVESNNITGPNLSIDKLSTFNKSQLKQFIDDNNLDISYDKLSAKELENEIKESKYTAEMLDEWYDKTNRSVGTMKMTTLDGIHEKIIENKINDKSWVENSKLNLEVFDSFDPYDSSEEAVAGYKNEEYSNLILHCLADVARTVNLTRIMVEYISPQDYRPKTL